MTAMTTCCIRTLIRHLNHIARISDISHYGSVAVIVSDEKMGWVYLKDNKFKLDVVGYKGHEDPKEIMDFIKEYINYDKMYQQALTKKLNMFYGALEWKKPQMRMENSWF